MKGVRLQKAGTMEVSIGKHRRMLETFAGGGGELEVRLRLLVEGMTQDYCCPLCSYTPPAHGKKLYQFLHLYDRTL